MRDEAPKSPGFPTQIEPLFKQLRIDASWLAWKLRLYQNAFLTPANREVLFAKTATVFCSRPWTVVTRRLGTSRRR